MTPDDRGIIIPPVRAIIRKFPSPDGWERLRAGLCHQFDTDTGDVLQGKFRVYWGFCNAEGGGPGVAGCRHFFGVRTDSSSLEHVQGTGYAIVRTNANSSTSQQRVEIRDGVMVANSLNAGGSGSTAGFINIGAVHSSTADRYRCYQWIDLVRTAPGKVVLDFLRPIGQTSGIATNVLQSDANALGIMESDDSLADLQSSGALLSGTYGHTRSAEMDIDEDETTGQGPINAVAFAIDRTGVDYAVGKVRVAVKEP